jgi:hypothetical protein
MSLKYPTHGKARPYRFDPFNEAEAPAWFTGDREYFSQHCTYAYLAAMEEHIAGMPPGYLEEKLKEAESDPDNPDYTINCDLPVETDLFIPMMEAEVAYRQEVDAKQKLLVN